MQTNCCFANDEQLTFDSISYQKILMDSGIDATRLIDPCSDKIGGGHHIAEALGNAIRTHPPVLSR